MLLSNKLKFHFLKINVGACNVLLYLMVFSVGLVFSVRVLYLELLKHFCVVPHKEARTSYALFYPFNRNHDSIELLHQEACKNFN